MIFFKIYGIMEWPEGILDIKNSKKINNLER